MSQPLVWFIWVVATVYAVVRCYRIWRFVRSSSDDLWHEYSDSYDQTFAPAARVAKGALWYWLAASSLLASTYWPDWPEAAVLGGATALFILHGSFATFWPAVYAYLHPSPEPPGDAFHSDLVEVIDDD